MMRFLRQVRACLADGLTAGGYAVSPQELGFLTGGVFAVLESWMQGGCQRAKRNLTQHIQRCLVAPDDRQCAG